MDVGKFNCDSKKSLINTIKKHILVEFLNKPPYNDKSLLLEHHGYVDDGIVDIIISDIKEKGVPYTLDNMSIFQDKPFFDAINLMVNAIEDKSLDDFSIKGSYIPKSSGRMRDGKYLVTINLIVKFPPSFSKSLLNEIKIGLSHEFLHAFDDYNERLNGGSVEQKAWKNGYYRSRLGVSNNFRRFNYLINSMERNAFIGQLKSELEVHREEISSIQDAWNVLKYTNSFKQYLYLNDFVEDLKSENNPIVQEKYLKDYNSINNKHLIDYQSLIKQISRQWYKWKHKYDNVSGKILYDVFIKNFTTLT